MEESQDSNHRRQSTDSDMDNTVEYRILMAYAQRRRPKPAAGSSPDRTDMTDSNGTAPTLTPGETQPEEMSNKKKKKKGLRRILNLFKCIQPQTEKENEPRQARMIIQGDEEEDDDQERSRSNTDDEADKDAFVEVASRLTEIADEIPFTHPDIEEDTGNDVNVEKAIGLILRETGDKVNEEELKKLRELFWDYKFFHSVIKTLLTKMGLRSLHPDSPGPHVSPKTQMAVACEAVIRLSALDTQPMNKLLGFGARYLNEQHSSWVKEHGGYEAAFEDDEEVQ